MYWSLSIRNGKEMLCPVLSWGDFPVSRPVLFFPQVVPFPAVQVQVPDTDLSLGAASFTWSASAILP